MIFILQEPTSGNLDIDSTRHRHLRIRQLCLLHGFVSSGFTCIKCCGRGQLQVLRHSCCGFLSILVVGSQAFLLWVLRVVVSYPRAGITDQRNSCLSPFLEFVTLIIASKTAEVIVFVIDYFTDVFLLHLLWLFMQ